MNLFSLVATLGLDSSSYEDGLKGAESKASSFGNKLGSLVSGITKITVAGATAAGAAATAITKSAVGNFAEFEQLAGGIETLFGDSAGAVIRDADEAFKTAGMSANQYMETAITSAASLINSLGGDQAAAAELMNMSITDMSDNVNKMGTSMEAVQNAYRGFSRGNFTMLDNLALGFAGTKEGMQELLDKAEEISGIKYDISSYADIVKAINVVQTEMGIAGTTAKEAAGTISGSAGSMKAAWDNLVTSLAKDNADLGGNIDALISSIETTISNVIPTAERALNGLSTAVVKMAPLFAETVGNLFASIVPALTESVPGVLKAMGKLVMSIAQVLVDNSDLLIQTGFDIILMVMDGITGNADMVSEAIGEVISSIGLWIAEYSNVIVKGIVGVVSTIAKVIANNAPIFIEMFGYVVSEMVNVLSSPETLSTLATAILEVLSAISTSVLENIPVVIDTIMVLVNNIVTFITENLPMFIDTAVSIIMALADGFMQALPSILEMLPEIINAIVETLVTMIPIILDTGITLLLALIDGFIEALPQILEYLPTVITSVIETLLGMIPDIVNAGITLLVALVEDLPTIINTIIDKMPEIINSIVSTIIGMVPQLVDAGVKLLTALVTNLPQIIMTIVKALPKIITSICQTLTGLIPQIVQAGVTLLTSLIRNLPQIIVTIVRSLPQIISSIVSGLMTGISQLAGVGVELVKGLWSGIQSLKDWLWNKVSGWISGIWDGIKNFFGIASPSKEMAWVGEMLDKGLVQGIEKYADLAVDAAESMSEDVANAVNPDIDFTANANQTGGLGASNRAGVVVNVYGAEGQDVNELAEIISQKMAYAYNQDQVVWA